MRWCPPMRSCDVLAHLMDRLDDPMFDPLTLLAIADTIEEQGEDGSLWRRMYTEDKEPIQFGEHFWWAVETSSLAEYPGAKCALLRREIAQIGPPYMYETRRRAFLALIMAWEELEYAD